MPDDKKSADAVQSSEKTRDQYETYPYPARNPEDEDKRLVTGSPGNWDEVVHFVFGGRDPSSKGKIKILVAGGGTGDALVMLAQQARDRKAKAEIVYIDLSESSREIAEARIKRRNLEKNVTFVTGSFVDLAKEYGPFDYIDCCGVLHHLPDPDAGLRTLTDALKPNGGMGLMVYGELGRQGVYHMQEMMERLNAEAGGARRLHFGKALFNSLPGTNWLKRNPFIGDHIHGGDAGFYDLLLHQQDRAYRVDEVFDFVEQAGLRLQSFIEPMRYDPTTYCSRHDVLEKAVHVPFRERAALAELMAGNITKHIFYVVKAKNKVKPPVPDEDAIPFFTRVDGAALARSVAKSGNIKITFTGLSVTRTMPAASPAILSRIDGKRSIRDIYEMFDPKPEKFEFNAQFAVMYSVLNAANLMYLRYPDKK
ncbi:bifunctional 2-polyprenyl-6-hydroxyphenol methylase/3-demethylubiquinol 3-O-methyltransferase UbiG [Thalassospira profundimaris]|uniref:Methyltransferase n=1 Tax=Thalassospira profundimaris TaxID=502049 RepID=A0A367X6Q6_9PROT|nr:class I SAM-dependent methyltransferase [Thalassospira profundimaris]RCK49353.1 methyltransferase [Thalassospira profundimaris]